MTACSSAEATRTTVLDRADPVGAAAAHVSATALRDDARGRVGLELELHLVDLRDPRRRPAWAEVVALTDAAGTMPGGSTITLEPGGQVELSSPPLPGVVDAVAALRADRAALAAALAEQGYGAAPLGTDPARPVRRVNTRQRYVAMEEHFDAVGCGTAGRAMMSATAALQINLDAGPRSGWEQRLELVRAVAPVLVALSACSSHLAGVATGHHSMRQEVWRALDQGRCGPLGRGRPAEAWASYALAAPVMLLGGGGHSRAVRRRVSFQEWLETPELLGRLPTVEDLELHLSTLFPPVRPRGYLELRCLDALPDRWWPALAAITVTLLDDPVAADAAAAACEPVAGDLAVAARRGLADPALRSAAVACVDVAARRCPDSLRTDVAAVAETVSAGRTPGADVRDRIQHDGPWTVLEEEARA